MHEHNTADLAVNIPGVLMVLLGLLAVVICQQLWKTPLRLFGLGMLLWAIAVAIKGVIAVFLNAPILALLQHHLPKHVADVSFGIFIGLLTGITEVGIFLVMFKWFQRRQWSWEDAASIGVGFGAIESALLGLGMVVAIAMGSLPNSSSFVPVLERFLTIFIHVASTVAAVYAVTRRKWGWFVFAFLYKSGVDIIAGYINLAGMHLLTSKPWFVELALVGPFAYIAIPILLILKKRWQTDSTQSESTND